METLSHITLTVINSHWTALFIIVLAGGKILAVTADMKAQPYLRWWIAGLLGFIIGLAVCYAYPPAMKHLEAWHRYTYCLVCVLLYRYGYRMAAPIRNRKARKQQAKSGAERIRTGHTPNLDAYFGAQV